MIVVDFGRHNAQIPHFENGCGRYKWLNLAYKKRALSSAGLVCSKLRKHNSMTTHSTPCAFTGSFNLKLSILVKTCSEMLGKGQNIGICNLPVVGFTLFRPIIPRMLCSENRI